MDVVPMTMPVIISMVPIHLVAKILIHLMVVITIIVVPMPMIILRIIILTQVMVVEDYHD